MITSTQHKNWNLAQKTSEDYRKWVGFAQLDNVITVCGQSWFQIEWINKTEYKNISFQNGKDNACLMRVVW